jgi:hypothetical protein
VVSSLVLISTRRVVDLAPRDDIESLAFVAFFLLRGNLPWIPRPHMESQSLSQEIARIMKLQCSTPLLSTGFPNEFGEVLTYSRSLEFGQLPDHEALRRSFTSLAEKLNYTLDGEPLDWTPSDPKPIILLAQPEISIPDEKKDDDSDDDLGEDSYFPWDMDYWDDRQGERDKDLTLSSLSATQETDFDRITPQIVEVDDT